MKSNVEWLPEAEADLAAIVDFIFADNPMAAIELEAHAFHSAETLAALPYLGRSGRAAGSRELIIHPNYMIVYEVYPQKITVLAVLHTRQAYP